VIRAKNRRLEVVRTVRWIFQWVLRTPDDSNPASELMVGMMAMMATI
jgi:glycerol-3-phosphate cytidylyltransferase-like family protein